MPLRSIAFALLALSITFLRSAPAVAQQPTATPSSLDTDKIDSRAFSILFRRENAYLRIAKTASSPDDPKSALRTVIPSLFQLDSVEAGNLEQIAAQWEQ